MGGPINPLVGIVADTKLLQYTIAQVVSAAGYGIGLNVHPNKIKQVAKDTLLTVDVWMIELAEEETFDEALHELAKSISAPVLFGEGVPAKSELRAFKRWQQRLLGKLYGLVGPAIIEPQIDGDEHEGSKFSLLQEFDDRQEMPCCQRCETGGSAPPAKEIWVLGASLGGPDAIKQFLDALPNDLPIAFILAQHIDANFQQVLAQVLGRHNQLNVAVGSLSGQHQLCQGDLFICSSQFRLCLSECAVASFENAPWPGDYTPSIDAVIETVSQAFPQRSGAIIFGGMGCDGAKAAAVMSQQGGKVWAQSEESCIESSMPDAARKTGCVTLSGTPQSLAKKLGENLMKKNG